MAKKQCRQEPINEVNVIPKKPWEIIGIDFGGLYSDGHYNLLATDKRKKLYTTAFRPMVEKLKTMFATHGMLRQLESDNDPLLNLKDDHLSPFDYPYMYCICCFLGLEVVLDRMNSFLSGWPQFVQFTVQFS